MLAIDNLRSVYMADRSRMQGSDTPIVFGRQVEVVSPIPGLGKSDVSDSREAH